MGRNPRRAAATDLAQYLAGEFQQGDPMCITSRRPDRGVGYQLSDRMVTRLELLSAMRRLPFRQRRILELLYVDGETALETASRLNISERTLYRERAAALDAVAAVHL